MKKRTLQERAEKVKAYCRWLKFHGLDENLNPRRGFNAMISCTWVIDCLEGLFDGDDAFDRPYQLSDCACDACEAERARCGLSRAPKV